MTIGVPCPVCGCVSSTVLDGRPTKAGYRRRRVCDEGHRFSTKEEALRLPAQVSMKKLRRMRRNSMTLKEVAKALGVSVTTVWSREQDDKEARLQMRLRDDL